MIHADSPSDIEISIMRAVLSPKQVAKAIGVSESSLKRWCDKGLLEMTRTAGGHRRLALRSVVQFLRATGQPLAHPELLGLPVDDFGGPIARPPATPSQLSEALIAGNEPRCRRMLLNLYLEGTPLVALCDDLIAPAFAEIGHAWMHGAAAVYQERRAVEICSRLLQEFRAMLPAIGRSAPQAFGGALAGDPYQLPPAMIEIVLREAGWRAESYGIGLPAYTLQEAIERQRPTLLWLSVSTIGEVEQFLRDYQAIEATATRCGVAVAVGGRALTPDIVGKLQRAIYCGNLHELVRNVRKLSELSQ